MGGTFHFADTEGFEPLVGRYGKLMYVFASGAWTRRPSRLNKTYQPLRTESRSRLGTGRRVCGKNGTSSMSGL
jgi:hypothetical protein